MRFLALNVLGAFASVGVNFYLTGDKFSIVWFLVGFIVAALMQIVYTIVESVIFAEKLLTEKLEETQEAKRNGTYQKDDIIEGEIVENNDITSVDGDIKVTETIEEKENKE